MALGIGANAAILSVVEATRLRPLPFDDAFSLVEVWLERAEPSDGVRAAVTAADLRDLRAEPGLFAALAGWRATTVAYVGLTTQEVIDAAEVTAGMFSGVLRVQPFLGRTFLPEEDRPDAAPSVLLSHAFWSEHFGGDPQSIGRSVVLDGTPHVIVGVMPPGLRPPFQPGAKLWTPARLEPRRCRTGCPTVSAVGRLAPGTRLEIARDRASALGQRLSESYPESNRGVTPSMAPLGDPTVRMSPETTRLLLSAGALVLLLACSNIALLLLARGVDRSREMSVRRSVGASRASLAGQLLAESVGLAMAGAVLGVGVAVWVLEAIERSAPLEVLGGTTLALDTRVLSVVALLTVGAGLLFGLGPALVGARLSAASERSGLYASVTSIRAARLLRGAMGALQIGLATVLIIGAGGLLRSLHQATGDALGFDPQDVLTVEVELTSSSPYSTAGERASRLALAVERLEAIPAVFSVGAATSLPFEESSTPVEVLVKDEEDGHEPLSTTVVVRAVSPAYFYTLRQRLSDGRWFRTEDQATSTPVAIVSSTAARRLFSDPPRSAPGAEIALQAEPGATPASGVGSSEWRTVVGVVRDEWADSELRASDPVVYVPTSQAKLEKVHFVLRVDAEPLEVAPEVREALGEIDSAWRSGDVLLMEDRVGQSYAGERFGAVLAASFAGLALILSLVGLFGVLAHAATTRIREWGLRRAVGATDHQVRGSILARAGLVAIVGVLVGGVGANLLVQGLDAVFAGEGLRTPMVYAGALTLLAGVVVVASAWPARQSVAVDVISALRAD